MKASILLTCAVAALALTACNKDKSAAGGTTAANESVKITQASPPPGGTWADVANETSAGFMMGNPNAKVRLVEIGSLFCPYCKRFEDEGSPVLVEKYVKTGQVSWEFRPYIIHGPIDMAANLVARCAGLKSFFPLTKALYRDQPTLAAKVEATPQNKLEELQNLPTNQIFVTYANILGLQDWAAARGLPVAKSNQCLSDPKMIDREVQLTTDVNSQYPEFSGTPAFVLNGKMLKDVGSWDKLEPELKDALK